VAGATRGSEVWLLLTLATLNLRGPVRALGTIYHDYSGTERLEEWDFDLQGRCVRRYTRSASGVEWSSEFQYGPNGEALNSPVRIEANEDGSRVEIHPVVGVDNWSMEGLHFVAFPTHDAAVARTYFDMRGVPVQTVFENGRGATLSTIHYEHSNRGQVRTAVQYSDVVSSSQPTVVTATSGPRQTNLAVPKIGGEECRASFEYDDDDRLIELDIHFAGQRVNRTLKTYTPNGDWLTSTTDGQSPVRCDYDYDHRSNWIRRVIRHSAGSDEETRTIAYYAE
jgi:hypothetical protein